MLVTAADAGPKFRELGEYADTPFADQHWEAGCVNGDRPDKSTCQVIAQVTGFQTRLGAHRYPYAVNHRGKVVAFTVKVGKPTTAQVTSFNAALGQPTVRISVLRPPPKGKGVKGHRVMRLVGQTGAFNLSKFLGRTVSFGLSHALIVPAGSTIALTTPTWAPVFAANAANDTGDTYVWRGSRRKGKCSGGPNDAQQTIGKLGFFDCFYDGPQLQYRATFLRDPVPNK